jgi:protein tyrosine/serine phosphatase
MIRFIFALFVLLSVHVQAKEPWKIEGVDEGKVLRSNRPSINEFESLKKIGLNTNISLESYALSSTDKALEKEASNKAMIKWINVPWSPLPGKLPKKKIEEILSLLYLSPKPILIHCYRGQDRTSLAVYAYRIRINHWTYEQADAEINASKFNKKLFGNQLTELKAYLKE